MKKGIIYSFIISMVICMIMPFHIYADSWSDIFEGSTLSYEKNVYTWTFKKHVLGYFVPTITFYYSLNGAQNQIRPVINVNGTQVSYEISNQELYNVSYSIYSYSLKSIDEMDLSEVIQYLSEMYDNQEEIIDQLELIYGKTDALSKLRQYSFPFESLNFNMYLLNNYEPVDISSYYSWTFPVFKIPNGSPIFESHMVQRDREYYLIVDFRNNIYDLNTLSNKITFNNQNFSFKTYNQLGTYWDGSVTHQIVKATFSSSVQAASVLTQIINNTGLDLYIIPFYCNYKNANSDYTTDFALTFGFSNKLLDDIHVIAAGTTQSNAAAGDLEQGTSDLASDISSYNQIESDYNNQMNQALNNIDFSDQFSNNQNFLSGASFVKTVFNSFMQIDILRIFFIVLCIVLIAKRFI